MSVMIARFDGVTDVTAGKAVRVTWPVLVERLNKFEQSDNKKSIGGWSPAIFRPFCECGEDNCPGELGHRKNENVLEVYALAFDLDKTRDGKPLDWTSAEAALVRLAVLGLRYIVHTTHSHVEPDHVSLRVVVAISRPVAGHEWERFWAAAVDHIAIHVEPVCRNLGRFWFLPSNKPGNASWSRSVDGAPLDVAALLTTATPAAPLTQAANTQRSWPKNDGEFDYHAFRSLISSHDPAAKEKQRSGRRAFDIVCPWESEHSSSSPRDTVASWTDAGKPEFSCLHSHCNGRHWQDFRAYLDPKYAEFRRNGFQPTYARPTTAREQGPVNPPNDSHRDEVKQRRERKAKKPNHDDLGGDGSHAGLGPRGGYRLTDLGNARRFADANRNRLRYVKSWGKWLTWDGRRWRRDETGSEVVAAKQVVASVYAEAAGIAHASAVAINSGGTTTTEGTFLEELTKWARDSAKRARVEAMIALAESEPELATSSQIWDADAWLLNVANGTIDLRTGEIRQHSQSDMITMLAPFDYDPHAKAPRWEAFLEQVQPDPEIRAWLQRYLGYALTGDVREQCLAFFFGGGSNGKSVLLDVVLRILGGYGLRAAADLVLSKHGEAHPTEVADLEGKRFVVCSEIEQGRTWAEALIKRITGDQTITARRMRMDFYTFPATHKLVVAANTRPVVRGTDHGIWRRMRLIPWGVRIPDAEQDKTLPDQLIEQEAIGILAWLVRGCLAWQNRGLGGTSAIEEATKDYRATQDLIGRWMEDRCVLGPKEWQATASLYESFAAWCKEEGMREPWHRNTWRERMLERDGIADTRKDHNSIRALSGVRLKGVL